MNASILLTKDVPSSAVLPPRIPSSQLPAHRLYGGCSATAVVELRVASEAPCLRVNDPASRAMTDFDRVPAFTVSEDAAIDHALDDMFRFGVRALLTIRDGKVTGLLTSYDIQGKRPSELMARATDPRR